MEVERPKSGSSLIYCLLRSFLPTLYYGGWHWTYVNWRRHMMRLEPEKTEEADMVFFLEHPWESQSGPQRVTWIPSQCWVPSRPDPVPHKGSSTSQYTVFLGNRSHPNYESLQILHRGSGWIHVEGQAGLAAGSGVGDKGGGKGHPGWRQRLRWTVEGWEWGIAGGKAERIFSRNRVG